jgi:predicted phosphodiesterase
MRVAIFSDVHGNLPALEAVWADIKAMAPDLTVFAGDLCLGGTRPAACIALLRQEDIAPIYGNTDEEVSQAPLLLSADYDAAEEYRPGHIDSMVEWTIAQLGEAERAWLRELPFHRRISPTVNPQDDLFIVHANPHDVEQHIYPPEAQQKSLYGEIKQADDDAELAHMLRDLEVGVLAFGHLHIPNVRHWEHLMLANISSVSLPLDGDTRAKYGLLEWQDGRWTVTHHYVSYDVEAEREQLAKLRPPEWESLSHRLQTGRA